VDRKKVKLSPGSLKTDRCSACYGKLTMDLQIGFASGMSLMVFIGFLCLIVAAVSFRSTVLFEPADHGRAEWPHAVFSEGVAAAEP
jgi:hypothetical protein